MLNKLIALVLPGVELVKANFFLPERLLIRLDFPTFERPENTILGRLGIRLTSLSSALVSEVKKVHFTVPNKGSTHRIKNGQNRLLLLLPSICVAP